MGYSSGQRDQTVNLTANAFEGSNPSPTMQLQYVLPVDAVGSSALEIAGVAQLVER